MKMSMLVAPGKYRWHLVQQSSCILLRAQAKDLLPYSHDAGV